MVRSGKNPHKMTLFHTVAHFRGSNGSGQALSQISKLDFCNEVKDLANILEEAQKENMSTN
jgi:hypothetical protein